MNEIVSPLASLMDNPILKLIAVAILGYFVLRDRARLKVLEERSERLSQLLAKAEARLEP